MITPAFSLNFTSATLDPRITFTRALGTATRINSSGLVEVVAADTPRFDYTLNTGGACKGLLIEESRANLILHSQAFDNPVWSKLVGGTGVTPVVTGGYPAPDGTNTAYRIQLNRGAGNTSSDYSLLRQAQANNSTPKTRSIFIKSNTGASQTVSLVATLSSEIVTATTEWTRVNGTSNSGAVQIDIANYGPLGTTRDVDIIVWGAQMEFGAAPPTSYIPTTTTALTRNADVATITGTNFSDWWQAGFGGALVRALPSTVSGTRPLVQFDDATADNIIALRGNTTNPELYIRSGGVDQATIDAGTIAANTSYNLTGWWQTDYCAARLDNGARVADTSATIPTVDQMRIGSDGTNYLNGHIALINYYDQFSSQIYNRRKNKAVFSVL
jgi:hypothetical protein